LMQSDDISLLSWLSSALFDRRIFRLADGMTKSMGITTLAGLISSGTNIAMLFLVSLLIGAVIHGNPITAIIPIICAMVLLLLVRGGAEAMRDLSAQRTSDLMKLGVRKKVYEHLLRLGPSYTEHKSSGSVAATIADGVDTLEQYVGFFIPCLILCFLVPSILFVAFTAILDLPVALILLAFVPLVPFSVALSYKLSWNEKLDIWRDYHDLSSYYAESLQGLTTLKMFGLSRHRAGLIHKKAETLKNTYIKALKIFFGVHYVCDVVPYLGYGLALLYACIQYSYGRFSLEGVMTVLLVGPVFYEHVIALSQHFHNSLYGKRALDTLEQIMQEEPQVTSPDTPIPVHRVPPPELRFEHISFGYETGREVLKDCSFTIKSGETVALVGASGVGKSTVIDLLYRFHNPQQGYILLEGTPIDTFPLLQLREQLSLVSQETYLFYDTIRNNILIGNPSATKEDIENAAKAAQIHDWICSLAQGYDTITGERGTRLSGGEKQRIAIARAILKDAPVLLLDEPTSSIDAGSEKLIQRALDELCKDRTVLVIAHRLSTIRRADRIMVMDEGRIVEIGTHEQLLETGGQYARLVHAQLRMLSTEDVVSQGGEA
ncbi:MAG TPA: ABC transporter ATP-binding protein/permease, partial [Methanospirillum sp.]|uniref:ABC transporter ATP-binding protein/permease n=1 Tax=Methanospirillum sp. TaxID=45200 RepID=UPI002D033CC5